MGFLEEAKGKVKQAAGDLSDNEALKTEGSAQADKGSEERQETESRAAAKTHEEKAKAYDQKQQAAEA